MSTKSRRLVQLLYTVLLLQLERFVWSKYFIRHYQTLCFSYVCSSNLERRTSNDNVKRRFAHGKHNFNDEREQLTTRDNTHHIFEDRRRPDGATFVGLVHGSGKCRLHADDQEQP